MIVARAPALPAQSEGAVEAPSDDLNLEVAPAKAVHERLPLRGQKAFEEGAHLL